MLISQLCLFKLWRSLLQDFCWGLNETCCHSDPRFSFQYLRCTNAVRRQTDAVSLSVSSVPFCPLLDQQHIIARALRLLFPTKGQM